MISKKYKKICTTPKYIDQFIIIASTITGCVPISAFSSLVGFPIGTTSFAIELKIFAITVWIRKYKSITKLK